MKTQKIFETRLIVLMIMILALVGSFSIKQEALSYGNDGYSGAGSGIYADCSSPFYKCSQLESITNYSTRIFFALILWTLTPAGLLFFLASSILVTPKTSKLKRGLAWIGQISAILIWASFMTILLLAHLDSVTLNAFGLGGRFLDTAIASGMAFFVVMFILVLFEKSVEYGMNVSGGNDGRKKTKSRTETESGNKEKEKRAQDSIKIAGMEFLGLKDKIRRKLKDGLKEIVDDEIERRL